jgi:hypothetical protein
MMKRILTTAVLSIALLLGAAAPAAIAKTKESAAHKAAVKKCNADYSAAVKEAKTKKGKERAAAMAAAKATKKQCIADAPK